MAVISNLYMQEVYNQVVTKPTTKNIRSIDRFGIKRFRLNATSCIKAFVFKFITVPAKRIRTSRRFILNIYTDNQAYGELFNTDFG